MDIRRNVQIGLITAGILLLVFLLDWVLPLDLCAHGIRPRRLEGLWGIALAPFLHADFTHLLTHALALPFLLAVSLCFSRKLTVAAILVVMLLGGSLVWVFGKAQTVYIGAGGLIFGLLGFLVLMGILKRRWYTLLLSLLVLFLYGTALLSILSDAPEVSWLGHASGLLTGVLAAWLLRGEKTVEDETGAST